MRIYYDSDLHVGAPTHLKASVKAAQRGIENSDKAIRGGDIVDAAARYPALPIRISHGIEALDRWGEKLGANGHTKKMWMLPGNHEEPVYRNGRGPDTEDQEMNAAIKDHCQQYPHIKFIDKDWVQIGDAIFTHGHKQLGYRDPNPHRLRKWLDRVWDPTKQTIGAGKLIATYLPQEKMVRKLHTAFAKEQLAGPVHHVFFGHTHTPFSGFTVPGLRLGGGTRDVQFHNTGVAMRWRSKLFQPLMVDFDDKGAVCGVEMVRHYLDNGHGR